MDKDKICFIRARQKNDYVVPAIQKMGYRVIIPYKDYNIFFRICRELWMRLNLPKINLWYNNSVKNIEQDIIIVKDPLITKDFIRCLRKYNKDKVIIFDYDNRVSMSLNPDDIREYTNEIWSYDEDDCKKYSLRYKGCSYLDIYQTTRDLVPEYDVFYIGRDKNRLGQIHKIEGKIKEQGLKTYFYICADREFLTWKKKEYRPFLPYDEYLEILKKSKAVLNIVPKGQNSITQREMEAVFDGVKCITNNKGILDFDLYDESRYFLIDDNYEYISKFLEIPFKKVGELELKKYRFSNQLNHMLQNVQINK